MRAELLHIPGFPAEHAFTLRHRGASAGPWESLNLSDAVGDDASSVAENCAVLLARLGVAAPSLRLVTQVHGDTIVEAAASPDPDTAWPQADGQVSIDPDVVLVISVADCLPILFFDPVTGAAGAAHCGWKGTQLRFAGKMVHDMRERYGVEPADLRVALGPGIAGACYQVGAEVVSRFVAAGFPSSVAWPDEEGRYRLDLAAANLAVLTEEGVEPVRVFMSDACTHCDRERFYSYRRDGRTGRHWAMIRPSDVGSMTNAASTGNHAAPPRSRWMPLGPETDP